MIYLQIFWVFFQTGFIAFGGVMGVLPVLQFMVVDQNHWLTAEQFIQAFVIGQFVPGPNSAMSAVVGYWSAGIGGWVAAIIGIYLGPLIIMRLASWFYEKHKSSRLLKRVELSLRPLVIGLISATVLKIFLEQSSGNILIAVLFPVPIIWLYWKKKLSAITVMFASGVVWWGIGMFW
jgi:chromate transporter